MNKTVTKAEILAVANTLSNGLIYAMTRADRSGLENLVAYQLRNWLEDVSGQSETVWSLLLDHSGGGEGIPYLEPVIYRKLTAELRKHKVTIE